MSLVATIIVDNCSSPDRWVNKFIVECYSDVNLTSLVDTQGSDVIWNGTYSIQKDAIVFRGLVYGQTYYLRGGVESLYTHKTTYTTVKPVVAGASTAPDGVVYNVVAAKTSGGVNMRITPSAVPSDLDRYSAYWAPNPATAPDATNGHRWEGVPGADGVLEFFIGGGAGARFDVYIRAVNTSHKISAWDFIGTFSVGTLDDVGDGAQYGRVNKGALDTGNVDPRRSGVIKLGSTNPAWAPGGVIQYEKGPQDTNYAYMRFWWAVCTIPRTDGTNTSVPALAYPGLTVFNLLYNASYDFLPRVNEFLSNSAQTGNPIDFVSGGGAGGSPNIAFPTGSIVQNDLRNQALQSYQPLSAGPITIVEVAPAAPPVSGGGGGTGGGGGGGGSCPRVGMKVESKWRGVVSVERLYVGEPILTPTGWSPVRHIGFMECNEFIQVETWDGEIVEQDPDTAMLVNDGESKDTCDLTLSDLLFRKGNHNPRIKNLKVLRKPKDENDGTWVKVTLRIDEPHWFYCGKFDPTIATHNVMMNC